MSGREWKPGDVVAWEIRDGGPLRLFRDDFGDRWVSDREGEAYPSPGANLRPLVVIDPEDREQVARLVELLIDNGWRCTTAHGLRDALREFADPKLIEVFEHYPAQEKDGKTLALCGKVWNPGQPVEVVGRCPECVALVESGWTA